MNEPLAAAKSVSKAINLEQLRRDVGVAAQYFRLDPDECYELALHSPTSAQTCYRSIAASLGR